MKMIWHGLTVPSGVELLERHAVLQSPSRIEELVKVFIHATKVRKRPLPPPLPIHKLPSKLLGGFQFAEGSGFLHCHGIAAYRAKFQGGDLVADSGNRWRSASGRCSHPADVVVSMLLRVDWFREHCRKASTLEDKGCRYEQTRRLVVLEPLGKQWQWAVGSSVKSFNALCGSAAWGGILNRELCTVPYSNHSRAVVPRRVPTLLHLVILLTLFSPSRLASIASNNSWMPPLNGTPCICNVWKA